MDFEAEAAIIAAKLEYFAHGDLNCDELEKATNRAIADALRRAYEAGVADALVKRIDAAAGDAWVAVGQEGA